MASELSPKILGQLVLMQSIVSRLPDQEKVLGFLCRGLLDVPGVGAVDVVEQADPQDHRVLPVRSDQHVYCWLRFQVLEEASFSAYLPFVKNVLTMVGTILEERRQRSINQQLMEDLERRVQEWTRDLAEEKRRVDQYLENIEVILVVLDDKADIRLINRRGCEVLGRPAEELVGKNWFSTCLPPDEVDAVQEEYLGQVADPRRFVDYFENQILNGAGELRFVAWHNTRLVDDRGRFVGVLRSGEDITERRKAVNALVASEENLRITVDSIGDGVLSTDTDCRVTRINHVAEELTGWSRQDAIGRPMAEVFHIISERTRKPALNPAVEVLRTGRQVGLANHTILVSRQGREYQIADSAAPIRGEDGRIEGVVLVFRDVTEQYRLEAEASKAERLQSLGLLAGGIAHDFNNLLTSLFGNLELMGLALGPSHQAKPYLDSALRSMRNAKHLTRQLLTFAKGGEPIKETVDLATVIAESAKLHLRGSAVELHLDLASDLWKIEADLGQIDQVMSNLVINARQAMPQGGRIWIRARNEDHQGTPFVRIHVKDDGKGIEPEHLHRIFDPYFTTKPDGHGLGLATIHSIVERHKGTIQAQSRPGEGAEFIILLPATERNPLPGGAGGASGAMADPSTIASGRRILVMDDEEVVREVLRAMLVRLGWEVEMAVEGESAVARFREAFRSGAPFDLVMVDLTVAGGWGGAQAAKAIKEIDPQAKIVASSGYATDPIMANFQRFGFSGILAKPFLLQELKDLLERQIGP